MLHRVMFLLLVLAVPGSALAQAFVEPYGLDKLSREAYTILNDGTRVEGRIWSAYGAQHNLSWFTLKMDGEKRKFKAADVQQLVMSLSKLARMELVTGYIDSIGGTPWAKAKAIATTDWEQVLDRQSVYYEQAVMPGDKGKLKLAQLLNPGFNERIRVYRYHKATGGSKTMYLVVKDGQPGIVVAKKSYEEQFPTLFGDCEAFDEFPGKPQFEDFAAHVFIFDQACKKES